MVDWECCSKSIRDNAFPRWFVWMCKGGQVTIPSVKLWIWLRLFNLTQMISQRHYWPHCKKWLIVMSFSCNHTVSKCFHLKSPNNSGVVSHDSIRFTGFLLVSCRLSKQHNLLGTVCKPCNKCGGWGSQSPGVPTRPVSRIISRWPFGDSGRYTPEN